MRRVHLMVALIAIIVALGGSTSSGQDQSPTRTADMTSATCDSRSLHFHVARGKDPVKSSYVKSQWRDREPLDGKKKRIFLKHRGCLLRDEAVTRLNEFRNSKRKDFLEMRKKKQESYEFRQQVLAVTPYDCSSWGGGRSAIPCYVVDCESEFDWGAYNASGAAGYYQLMGEHGRRWPVNDKYDRLQHHQIAYSLWGGPGDGDWVCA